MTLRPATLLAATGGLPDIVFRQTAVKLFGSYEIDYRWESRTEAAVRDLLPEVPPGYAVTSAAAMLSRKPDNTKTIANSANPPFQSSGRYRGKTSGTWLFSK